MKKTKATMKISHANHSSTFLMVEYENVQTAEHYQYSIFMIGNKLSILIDKGNESILKLCKKNLHLIKHEDLTQAILKDNLVARHLYKLIYGKA